MKTISLDQKNTNLGVKKQRNPHLRFIDSTRDLSLGRLRGIGFTLPSNQGKYLNPLGLTTNFLSR